MIVPPKTLFAKDSKGKLRYWEICAGNDFKICIEYGTYDGAPMFEFEEVEIEKSTRDLVEQVKSRVNSRVNSKLKAGYVEDIEQARNSKRVNSLGFARPMLAVSYEKIKKTMVLGHNIWQYKLDGHRCLITNDCGENVAYSRAGNVITTIPDIVDSLDLAEGETIDGELYCHGVPLQTIGSWIKRDQENTSKLKYHAYDTISSKTFINRHYDAMRLVDNSNNKRISLVQYFVANGQNGIDDAHKMAVLKGYEGIMIRSNDCGYEDGKRSKSLIKVKNFIDDEFEIIDIEPSRCGDGVCVCVTNVDRKVFRVTAPGNSGAKRKFLIHRESYIGHFLKVKFQKYTDDGIPFQPIALWVHEPL